MGDPRGFLKFKRETAELRPVFERIRDFYEVCFLRSKESSEKQALRCMDCGTPFCHWACPLGNYIPEWNDSFSKGRLKEAFELLNLTNNFPEITGRVCPAFCEYSCVLGITENPVTIRENELAVIEFAFKNNLVQPNPPLKRKNKKIAIIGSGPAGLACANQLNKAGYLVEVFEKQNKIGGIMRYGIPDFKLEKSTLDRRLKILEKEGIIFHTKIEVGKDLTAKDLKKEFDAICLATGCSVPRDLKIEGRELKEIYFAMDYLIQANKIVAGEKIKEKELINAKDKDVVIIGGGDTGADCVGVAHRQGAKSVVQIEILPKPPDFRTAEYPWPKYPLICKTSSSHQEGGKRLWSVKTKKFIGKEGFVNKLICERLDTKFPGKSEFEIKADLVILALGFLHTEHSELVKSLNLELDNQGNIKTNENFMTSEKGIFACGDARKGQSLVVWAIAEGRKTAYQIDCYLAGKSFLPVI